MASSKPFIREGAVKELGRLMAGKDQALAYAAKRALESRQDEERDIHVRKAVDEVLNAYIDPSIKPNEERILRKRGGVPKDGSAWVEKDCVRRVIRGGSWLNKPRNVRSANRYGYAPGYRDSNVGFRLAQDL